MYNWHKCLKLYLLAQMRIVTSRAKKIDRYDPWYPWQISGLVVSNWPWFFDKFKLNLEICYKFSNHTPEKPRIKATSRPRAAETIPRSRTKQHNWRWWKSTNVFKMWRICHRYVALMLCKWEGDGGWLEEMRKSSQDKNFFRKMGCKRELLYCELFSAV